MSYFSNCSIYRTNNVAPANRPDRGKVRVSDVSDIRRSLTLNAPLQSSPVEYSTDSPLNVVSVALEDIPVQGHIPTRDDYASFDGFRKSRLRDVVDSLGKNISPQNSSEYDERPSDADDSSDSDVTSD